MAKKIAVVGAGSWGTALAIHAANCGHEVQLWAHSQDTLNVLVQKHENEIYLPGFLIPQTVHPTSNPDCVRDADYSVFVVPSVHFRKTFELFVPHLKEGAIAISAIKGLESGTGMRISEIVESLAGDRVIYAVLSGPSFAQEVAQQHPTAVVIGCHDAQIGRQIQNDFRSQYFRLYYNSDVLGIEIAAGVKNIIAIAAGVVSGLGYGYNTVSGLITRGLAEVNRLAVKLGAHPSTLAGLAGLGDLILTCTGHLSRNRQVGIELGRGRKIEEITGHMRMVAEGVRTTEAIHALAERLGVSMPITDQVYRVLYEGHDPRTAILELMSREPKQEHTDTETRY